MNIFAVNLIIAGIWAMLAGGVTITNLGVGFILGFIGLWAVKPIFPDSGYFGRLPRLARLTAVFLSELLVSSLRVAHEALRLRPQARPGIVAVPTRATTDTEILMLSSLITLTPGSLTLDISDDATRLYVHAMFLEDPDALRRDIADTLETPVLEALK